MDKQKKRALDMIDLYYPTMWGKDRIETLVEKNIITREDADALYARKDEANA